MNKLARIGAAMLMTCAVAFAASQTAQISPHASKTLTYQYTSDVNGVTLWIDTNASPGFIQYDGFTCSPVSVWKVNQVYPLPTATHRTQPAFSLQASCTSNGLTFSVVETGYAYWGGYGRTAGVYYFVQSGTITKSTN
jgi:hypothetical protein